AEFLRRHVAVDRKGGSSESAGAERALIEAAAGIGETRAVAGEHLDIGKAMMFEGHGLGGLEMGEARHDGGGMIKRPGGKRALQLEDRAVESIDAVADEQAEVDSDLIVAGTGGVQPARRLA